MLLFLCFARLCSKSVQGSLNLRSRATNPLYLNSTSGSHLEYSCNLTPRSMPKTYMLAFPSPATRCSSSRAACKEHSQLQPEPMVSTKAAPTALRCHYFHATFPLPPSHLPSIPLTSSPSTPSLEYPDIIQGIFFVFARGVDR